jgi:cysteine desulfurase/selenocysteine lyase
MSAVAEHEYELTKKLISGLKELSAVNVIGPLDMQDRGGVVSFTIDGVHPHDVGQVLDQYGIAVRTGHHCAWPLMKKLNLVGTTRASFHIYNDEQDVVELINAVKKVKEYFKVGV